MPTNTTNQQITIPIGTDAADGPQAFIDQTADLETRLVQRFISDADRTARNPAPTTGELSIVTTNTWYDRWTGSRWLPVTPIQVRKSATQTVNNSTVLVNDATLVLPIPAVVAQWAIEAWIFYTSNTTADFKCTFAADAAITSFGFSPFALATGAAGVTGDCTVQGSTVLGTAIAIGGAGASAGITLGGRIASSGVAGVLQFQWAQNTADASNTQVLVGSWLRLTAIS